MSNVSGKAWDTALFKRIMRYVRPYKNTFIVTAFLVIVLAILGPLRPWLIQHTIDEEVKNFNADGVLKLTLIMIGVLILV